MDPLIDSHAHLTDRQFGADLPEVLQRAVDSGIDRIVTIAETLEDAEHATELVRRYPAMLSATAGVHPHKAGGWTPDSPTRLAAMLESGAFVAIGEIGLDFHYNFSTPDEQRTAFLDQLRLAREMRRPTVIHCREAYGELIRIMEEEGPFAAGGVVHCYSGDMAQARRLIELGFHIGITGVITFKKAEELRRIVAEAVPLERLLIETDCPYLAPEPHRGKRNEPAFVRLAAERIAAVRSLPISEIAAATRRNTMSLFKLGA